MSLPYLELPHLCRICCFRAQVSSVRAALDKHSERLDEALLSNCFAWMKKCQDDRMDTMVALLQKVLQLYAAKALRGQEAEVRLAAALGLDSWLTTGQQPCQVLVVQHCAALRLSSPSSQAGAVCDE